jgi:signal transduction histidine kinase
MPRQTLTAAQKFAPEDSDVTESHDVYRAHWETSREGLFSVRVLGTSEFIFDGINRPLQILTGLGEADFVGKRPEEVLDPAGAAWVINRYRECVRRGAPLAYFEVLNLPIGSRRWRTVLTPVRNEAGAIVRLAGVAHPIVPEAYARKLRRARRDYQRSIDLSPNPIVVLDPAGVIAQVNSAWIELDGPSASADVLGRTYIDVCRERAHQGVPRAEMIARDLAKILSGRIETFLSLPYEHAGAFFVVRARPIQIAGARHVLLVRQEVTELVKLQRELSGAMERLLTIQDDERARIAIDLHDSLSQHLVAIGMSFAAIRRRGTTPDAALEDGRAALAEAHREVRSLSYLLHPSTLGNDGIGPSLERYVNGFSKRTGLKIEFKAKGALDLPLDVQNAILRVVQEALTNVHRHAGASAGRVWVVRTERGLHLLVSDNGSTPVQDGAREDGVGVPGMRARMRQFGGNLHIKRTLGGTRVFGYIPQASLLRL